MCTVSMVVDQMKPIAPTMPTWTWSTYNEYTEILRRLDAIDQKLGLPACDPMKLNEHLKEIKELLTARKAKERKLAPGVKIQRKPPKVIRNAPKKRVRAH